MRTSRNTEGKSKPRARLLPQYMQVKLAVALLAILLAFLVLIVVIYQLVSRNSENYNKIVLSQRQASYDSRMIPFRRGDITDRNGTVLAISQKVYNLILDPQAIYYYEDGRYVDATIEAVAEYFQLDRAELASLLELKKDKRYVKYLKQLSYDDKSGFLEFEKKKNQEYQGNKKKERIRGIWFEDEYRRSYPYNSLACNILGFAAQDGMSGNGGVEQYYNDTLTGTNGREYGYLDEDVKLQSVIKEPTDGNRVVTTINYNIQSSIEKHINDFERNGVGSKMAAAIVMDPKSGEILGMASNRQYDLNNPRELDPEVYTEPVLRALGLTEAVGVYQREHPDEPSITEEQVPQYFSEEEILSYGKQVAWNRIWRNVMVSDTYEPGSTVKPFTIAGAMEEGIITPNTTFKCEGYLEFDDGEHSWTIKCHNHDGHGVLNATEAIMESCNVYLMRTALAEGAERFVKYQQLFGFGEKTGIDLPAEEDASDLVYTADTLGKVSLATNSFGQNFNVTMMQMASAYASLVNGGSYYRPHVVKRIVNADDAVIKEIKPEVLRVTCSKETSDFIRQALYRTVEDGTGVKAQISGYHVGGKTGTAEKLPRSAKNYLVSFMGVVPAEDPQLLVYVIVDTPNLEGEDQASASFAIGIEQKIMNDALQFLNIAPQGETDPGNSLNHQLSELPHGEHSGEGGVEVPEQLPKKGESSRTSSRRTEN